MSFGYSVGDFLAGASLTYQLVRALSASRGACIEYQEALAELRAMEQAFIQTGNLVRSNMFTRDVINAIACIALSSIDTIEKFLERTRDLQSRLIHGKNGLDNSWSKIGWQLYRKEELRALKTQLHERLSSINTLITTASNCIEIPSVVAQYQDKSMGNPTNHYTNRESTPSLFPPEYSQCDSSPLSSTTIAPSGASEQMLSQIPDSIQVVEINSLRVNESPASNKSVGYSEQRSVSNSLHHNPSVQKVPLTEGATPRGREFDKPVPRKEKSEAELEREIRAKIEIENAEAAAAAEAAVADAQIKSNIEMIKQMMASLHEKEARREAEARATAARAKEFKAPIRFKDAVGRKFSFPFHECQRWQGMEDLIKQAFLHVDVIGPHVQAGHYDLLGPNGEIILPQIWDKVIEPDWHITMHMWPMDRPRAPVGDRMRAPAPPLPPPPPIAPNSAQQRPQHYRPDKPTAEHPINDPGGGKVPTNGQKGVLQWLTGGPGHPGEREAKSVGIYEPKKPMDLYQFQDRSRADFHDAKGGLKNVSNFELLDRFDPNWREAYKSMISSRGLTDEFIRTHQVQIVRFLQNERRLVTVQTPKGASSSSGECSSRPSSSGQESDAHKRHPRFKKSGSFKPHTRFKLKRRTTFKKRHLGKDWQTDEEDEE